MHRDIQVGNLLVMSLNTPLAVIYDFGKRPLTAALSSQLLDPSRFTTRDSGKQDLKDIKIERPLSFGLDILSKKDQNNHKLLNSISNSGLQLRRRLYDFVVVQCRVTTLAAVGC